MKSKDLKFIQITSHNESLHGLTKDGEVWKYDHMTESWFPLSMANGTVEVDEDK